MIFAGHEQIGAAVLPTAARSGACEPRSSSGSAISASGRFGEFAAAVQINLDDREPCLGHQHGDVGPAIAIDIAIGRRHDRFAPGGDQIVLLREAAEMDSAPAASSATSRFLRPPRFPWR